MRNFRHFVHIEEDLWKNRKVKVTQYFWISYINFFSWFKKKKKEDPVHRWRHDLNRRGFHCILVPGEGLLIVPSLLGLFWIS